MTYRTPQDELLGCLSLLEEEKVERIYVIDNSPTDEIRSLVQEFRTVEYIHRPDNPGYGAAHNVAIRDVLSRGVEYHLVLNSDITFERGTLAAIIEMMDRRPETGLLQPRIIYPDGREQYSSRLLPSPLDLIGKRFLPHRFLSRRLNRYMLTDRPEREELNIPYHQGSFMFFRVAALRKIGLFDERFFMYPEDIDLTRRIHERFLTLYYPEVSVTHAYAAESRTNPRMLAIHAVNMMRYFNKWGWLRDKKRRAINDHLLRSIADNTVSLPEF